MIGRFSKHAAIFSATQGGVTPFRPITEGDFVYSGSYSISPYGELYLTSDGNLQFSQTYKDSYFDFCIVGGGGGGGNSSATTGTSNRAQTGGGGGGGAVMNIFKYRDSNERRSAIGYAPYFTVYIGNGGANGANGYGTGVFADGESTRFVSGGGYAGESGSAASKKSGNGGNGGDWHDYRTEQDIQGGSGGGGGSYGPNQVGGAGGTNGSNGANGTTNNASAGTPGTGGIGGGIDCHCFEEEWNTLFGSGGQGGSGNVSQAGANGANYRGNGGGGASTTYNNTSTTRGGTGGRGVVVVRFHCSPRPEPPVGLLGGFNMFSEE